MLPFVLSLSKGRLKRYKRNIVNDQNTSSHIAFVLCGALARPDQQTLVTATGMEDFDAPFLERARKIRVEGARLYPS